MGADRLEERTYRFLFEKPVRSSSSPRQLQRIWLDMAIYHLTVKHGSRAEGQSAMAKLEYIARLGKYADRGDLALVESGHLPSWAPNALAFWGGADSHSRANARLFTEIEAALPTELSREQMIALVRAFIGQICSFGDGHVPYTYGIHIQDGNPHVHLALASRIEDGVDRADAAAWFKRANKQAPERGGATSWSERTDKVWIEQTRALFARLMNEALAGARSGNRVDHRSHARRGLAAVPTQHAGWAPRRRKEVLDYNARTRAANEEARVAAEQVHALRMKRKVELEEEELARRMARESSRETGSIARLDDESVELLQRENAVVVGAASSTQMLPGPTPSLLPEFLAKKGRYGTLYIRLPADKLALIDSGHKLTVNEDEPASIRAALVLAASRWQDFEVTCASGQCEAWLKEAAALGLAKRMRFNADGGGNYGKRSSKKPRLRL
jgi:hypothetical protein